MNLKKKAILGGLVASLVIPTVSYASVNQSVQDKLIKQFQNYDKNIQLNIEGTSKEEFNNYIKNVRQYNVDSIEIGGVKDGNVNLYVKYYESKEDLKKVDRIVSLIATEVSGLTDKEKVYYITQRIGELLEYEEIADNTVIFSPYAVVEEGKGVCQAYARLADRIFKKVKIDTRFVEGTINDTPHIWNAVKIEGEWFGVDPTSADVDSGSKIDFNYVLMNSAKQKDLNLKVTYSPVIISNRNIQDSVDVGLISTKSKVFWSKEGDEIYSVDYKGDLNIGLVTMEVDNYWVLGGDLITLKDGVLSTDKEVLARFVTEEQVSISNSNLKVNDKVVYSPITLPESRVRAVYGDSKVVIKNNDKNYYVEYLENRTNVYYKNNFLIQMLRY